MREVSIVAEILTGNFDSCATFSTVQNFIASNTLRAETERWKRQLFENAYLGTLSGTAASIIITMHDHLGGGTRGPLVRWILVSFSPLRSTWYLGQL